MFKNSYDFVSWPESAPEPWRSGKSPMTFGKARPPRHGFTLVEVLVSLAVIALMATATVPTIRILLHRSQILGITRDTAAFMRLARLEAIRGSVTAQVRIDAGTGEVFAFVDEDGNGVFDDGERRLGYRTLPAYVRFAAPPDVEGIDSVDGFEVVGNAGWVVFNADGSAVRAGAFRFGDGRDNFLEVRAAPRTTARVELRMYDAGADAWYGAGEGGSSWDWK